MSSPPAVLLQSGGQNHPLWRYQHLSGQAEIIAVDLNYMRTGVMDSPSPEEGMGDEFDLMDHSDLYILDFSPSLKTLCKLAVIQYSLDQSCLPHDIRWELSAMTTNSTISRPIVSNQG